MCLNKFSSIKKRKCRSIYGFSLGKKFMRSDHLSKHTRTHANQRHTVPVRAEIIGMVASAASSLTEMTNDATSVNNLGQMMQIGGGG